MSNNLNKISLVERIFPFLGWLGELKDGATLRADLVAGITVALVLVPQSMAYAQLAGLPAYYGLYAAFLPGIVAALFGSSRQLATGPVAVVSLMTASALEPMAGANVELFVSYAILLAFMVGVFQLTLGLLRLGILVDFLSHPVVIGFTNAAAIIIATSQLGKLFGVTVEKAAHHYETVWRVVLASSHGTHIPTLLMAILAFSLMVAIKKFRPKWPAVLVAVLSTTLLSWMTGFEGIGGAVVGTIPQGLPAMQMPVLDLEIILQLATTAIAISLIGFMEAISIAKAIAARTRQRLDANQELVGQGLSNIVAGLFQSYPVSGSFSRSAVNIDAGAKTGFSAVVTGIAVGITLLALTPLLYHLPQATLAAVIIMAVANLVKVGPIIEAWKVQKLDGVAAIVTFTLTLVLAPHLEKGIIVGVVLSLAFHVFRTMRPRISELSRSPDGTLRDARHHKLETCNHISILRFDGSLYFANAGFFETKVLENVAATPGLKYIIIDAESINNIDATGEGMLRILAQRLQAIGVELLIARAKKQIMDTFERTGFVSHHGPEHFFRLRTAAVSYAWNRLGDEHDIETCPIKVPRPLTIENPAD